RPGPPPLRHAHRRLHRWRAARSRGAPDARYLSLACRRRYPARMAAPVKLHGMAYGGAAVGRLEDGAAVFVHGALEGELAEIDVVERRKNFARGRLLQVLEPSKDR